MSCTLQMSVIKLSQREMQVLSQLVSNMNRVVDRKDLLLTVWGDDSFFNSRNLDVYIRKLRQYFKEDESIQYSDPERQRIPVSCTLRMKSEDIFCSG